MTRDMLERALRPLYKLIANLVSRAVVTRVDDSTELQALQVKVGADEVRDGLERFQQYGLTSVPDAGAEAVVLFVGGQREVGYVVAVDDRRYRVAGLAPGEVALYSKAGASVVLKADGSVVVTAGPGASVVLNGGAQSVARVGDTAGPYPITGGNPFVKA
jgi:phage baseplate assembly protein V